MAEEKHFAIYDDQGAPVAGPFISGADAEAFLASHPILDLYDGDGEAVGYGFAYYAAAVQHGARTGVRGATVQPRPRSAFDILHYFEQLDPRPAELRLAPIPPAVWSGSPQLVQDESTVLTHKGSEPNHSEPHRARLEALPLGSIDPAVAERTWFTADAGTWRGPVRFRFRILSFDHMQRSSLPPDAQSEIEGDVWLLRLEVVNLGTQPIDAASVRNVLILIDEEGFEFGYVSNSLDRDKPSGIHRFSGWSDAADVAPKIAVRGAVPYALPSARASYRIGVKDGSLSVA